MTANTTRHVLGLSGGKDSATLATYQHQQGLVPHYDGRRSGYYCCFFQRQSEWIGRFRRHPELFEKAQKYERLDLDSGRQYTWPQGTTLGELALRAEEIETQASRILAQPGSNKIRQESLAEEGKDGARCLACYL